MIVPVSDPQLVFRPLLIAGKILPLRASKSISRGQGRRNGSEPGAQAESLQCISARIVSVPLLGGRARAGPGSMRSGPAVLPRGVVAVERRERPATSPLVVAWMAGSRSAGPKAAAAPTDATLGRGPVGGGSAVPNGRVWTTGGPPRHAAEASARTSACRPRTKLPDMEQQPRDHRDPRRPPRWARSSAPRPLYRTLTYTRRPAGSCD